MCVEMEITNRPALEPYMVAVNDTIVKHGGRFLARAGATKLIEGGPEPKIIVIVEFPDAATYDRGTTRLSTRVILPHRLQNSTTRMFAVEGVNG